VGYMGFRRSTPVSCAALAEDTAAVHGLARVAAKMIVVRL
jgi:hypothetical protein